MTAHVRPRMTVDEFLAWAATQPGRFELVNGKVVTMSPERVVHGRLKFRIQKALEKGVQQAGLGCEVLPDGATVRVDAATAYEPDALVYCGERLDDEAVEVPNPLVVVEVISPGTATHDTGRKLSGYFQVPSVQHYLMVDPERRVVIHHRRASGELIETRVVREGRLVLDPPGMEFSVADLFPPE